MRSSGHKSLLLCAALSLTVCGLSQRNIINLNAHWEFKREIDDQFQHVHLPHTYNADDAFDDEKGYYRGKAVYRKVLDSGNFDPERRYIIRFNAVNQSAQVFVNGQLTGSHLGGYTAFNIDVSDALTFSNDTLVVEVDNSHDPGVPPLRGDFTFYGGIYRDVELINVAHTHFAFDTFGSDGIFIIPQSVSEEQARLVVRGSVSAIEIGRHALRVQVRDASGESVGQHVSDPVIAANGEWSELIVIDHPRLWAINDPYLYHVKCQIIEVNADKILDEVIIPYGVRMISFDPDHGFFLNGDHVKLIGVNRHQDKPGIGNALSTVDHIEDMSMIKELGANFLRTAHYPQDQSVLEYCDRNGIVVSMEIPLDHEITQSERFEDNCKTMTQEMIRQHFNHPSVVIWAYMNEMGLGKHIERDSALMNDVADLARELEELIRTADPYRYTMIPNHGQHDIYHHFGLTEIPMIVGWNLYYGWYAQDFESFGEFVDKAHTMAPDKPMIITEYGAGADPRLTSFQPERFDFSLDWSLIFHQAHYRQIMEREFIAGSTVWNMFDFGSESRQDAVPHVNNKGLCAFDRSPKPVYHYYRAMLSEDPVTVIEALPSEVLLPETGRRTIPVAVISNQAEVEVMVNDTKKEYPVVNGIASAEVELTAGVNMIIAGHSNTDVEGILANKFWHSRDLLRINFGTGFFYQPGDRTSLWHPDAEVPAGLIEVEGGNRFQPRDRGIGSDKAIGMTEDDPVYQTMTEGIGQIRIKVPRGWYDVKLHLASLDKRKFQSQEITVQEVVLSYECVGPFTAHILTTTVWVEELLEITFTAPDDQTFLNGLQIIRR